MELLVIGIIIVVCVLIFGKADTKKSMLNSVGLDLSENAYDTNKRIEFERYCKKAMKTAVEKYNVSGKNEKEFADLLEDTLYLSLHERNYDPIDYDDDGFPSSRQKFSLPILDHYIRFAHEVIERRIYAIKNDDAPSTPSHYDFTNNKDIKKYMDWVWDKYQYPWPSNWLQKDNR